MFGPAWLRTREWLMPRRSCVHNRARRFNENCAATTSPDIDPKKLDKDSSTEARRGKLGQSLYGTAFTQSVLRGLRQQLVFRWTYRRWFLPVAVRERTRDFPA